MRGLSQEKVETIVEGEMSPFLSSLLWGSSDPASRNTADVAVRGKVEKPQILENHYVGNLVTKFKYYREET